MANILLIDDDKEESKVLREALKAKGHAVEAASRGRAGVDRGLQMRPDILITNWWLREPPGGLRISLALRAIRPEVQSILITRYPTADVRQAALEAGFFGFFPKPVDLEKLHPAIEKAAAVPPLPVAEQVAFIEYDAASLITYASPAARELLRLAPAGGAPQRLADLLGNRNLRSLEGQRARWATVATAAAEPVKLEVFTMQAGGGKVRAFIVPEGAAKQKASPAMLLLIEAGTLVMRSQAVKKNQLRVLLIDEDRLQRRLLTRQLDGLGIQFHSTESPEQGIQLLEADPEIGVVIIDFALKDNAVGPAIQKIQDVRPEVKVIGTSTAFRKSEFAKMGASGFLPKPATPDALKAILTS